MGAGRPDLRFNPNILLKTVSTIPRATSSSFHSKQNLEEYEMVVNTRSVS